MDNEKQPIKINWMQYGIKLDRLAAWILLMVVIIYGVTGYGMTKGLISIDLARSLHLGWLGGFGLSALVIHTGWAIHLALKRHKIWNGFFKFALIACYTLLVLFFGWAQFFYQGNTYPIKSSTNTVSSTMATTAVFIAATLKDYNGLNGRPAYVAVDGQVYDMSSVFRNGEHHGYGAGQDLSAVFYSQHPGSYLEKYPIVGTYQNN
jgi:predicted heme/steroid binding protein